MRTIAVFRFCLAIVAMVAWDIVAMRSAIAGPTESAWNIERVGAGVTAAAHDPAKAKFA